MKVTPQMTEDVVAEITGRDVVPLVKALHNKENVSEFTLASRIKKEINVTRNMLYRLYEHNLVTFTRKKDKKKGWYIYYWTFNQNRVAQLSSEIKKRKLERLQERLDREKNSQFFACPQGCIRLVFDQAAEFSFKCPECGTLLEQEDNSQKIADIEKDIATLNTELKTTTADAVTRKSAKPKASQKKKVKKSKK